MAVVWEARVVQVRCRGQLLLLCLTCVSVSYAKRDAAGAAAAAAAVCSTGLPLASMTSGLGAATGSGAGACGAQYAQLSVQLALASAVSQSHTPPSAACAGYNNCCDAHESGMRCSICIAQACCTPVRIAGVCQLPAPTCSNSASSTFSSFLRPRPLLAGFLVAPRRPGGRRQAAGSACGLGQLVAGYCMGGGDMHVMPHACCEDIIVSSRAGSSCMLHRACCMQGTHCAALAALAAAMGAPEDLVMLLVLLTGLAVGVGAAVGVAAALAAAALPLDCAAADCAGLLTAEAMASKVMESAEVLGDSGLRTFPAEGQAGIIARASQRHAARSQTYAYITCYGVL